MFNRANNLRLKCEFDKAEQIYEKIVQENDTASEAHWGIVLCKYGIEYVEDPKTFQRIPTCHRTSYDAVTTDADYLAAIAHADAVQRGIYEAEAKTIDDIQKNILNIVKNEQPFDVFLCYKQTDEDGKRTADSVIANDIYYQLTQAGLKVFYAAITLEDKLGQAYEPYIFAALNSAKIMLSFGTDYEYFNAVWVKNEWSRYLKLMAKDKDKHLIPCYKGIDAYDVPKEFAKLQAQDLGKVGATQDLLRGIAKILSPQGSPATAVQKPATSTSAMVMRGQFALDDGDWAKADEYFERALDENPQDGQAYLGKVLVKYRVSSLEQLGRMEIDLAESKDYERAICYAPQELRQALIETKEDAQKYIHLTKLVACVAYQKTQKATEEFYETVNGLMAIPSVENYEKVLEMYSDAVKSELNPKTITKDTISSAERRLDILRLLIANEEISGNQIWSQLGFNPDNYLKRMVQSGAIELSVNDTGENYYAIAGTRKKRIQLRKENDYICATNMMSSAGNYGEFFEAAELYASIGDYLDSAEKAEECRQAGQTLKAEFEAEQARIKELQRLEYERREAEKKAAEAQRIEQERLERERQEAERKAAEEKRSAEIKVHNATVNAKIAEAEQALKEQNAIYVANASKIFGAGAKLKKEAKAEIARLEALIANLKRTLR